MKFLDTTIITFSETQVLTLGQLLLGIILLVLAWFGSVLMSRLLANRILTKTRLKQDNVAIIQKILFFAFLIFITMMVLTYLNIPLAAFAFVSGAVAIGVGFGARNIIENFLSGWILMSERPIRIGDVIDLDGNLGNVIGIGHRSTMIRRNDGANIVVPNSQILESKLINWTLVDPNIRTSVRVGVAYGTDLELVKRLLLEAVGSVNEIINEPGPLIVFEDFGDSALVFDVFYWVSMLCGKEMRQIRSDLRFAINKAFNDNGVVISFPQRDVHLHMVNGPASLANNNKDMELK